MTVGRDQILDGRRVADAIREEVAREVEALRTRGVVARLDVVLVGDDPASRIYVRSKAKTSAELGMVSETHELPETTSQAEIESLVGRRDSGPAAVAWGHRRDGDSRPRRPGQGR